MKTERSINSLREKIDQLDSQILRLLNERAEIVLKVGKLKAESNMEIYVPQREQEILRRLNSQNTGPFPSSAIPSVFREIISACRSLEGKLKVADLDPPEGEAKKR